MLSECWVLGKDNLSGEVGRGRVLRATPGDLHAEIASAVAAVRARLASSAIAAAIVAAVAARRTEGRRGRPTPARRSPRSPSSLPSPIHQLIMRFIAAGFRMDEECRYCEKWKEKRRKFEEHFYWGHVDAKRMHFSKSMIGDFSKCMIIPKKFIEHFTGELLETIELKVPSGDIWHVELKKTNDGVILDCGWKNFVDAHDIQQNDTLVFKYDGFSSFLVLMFDPSGCEKAASHCAKKRDPMHGSCSTASVKLGGHNSNLSSFRHSEQAQAITEHYENPRANGSAEEKSVKVRRNSKRNYVLKDLLVGSRKKKALKAQESGAIKVTKNPVNEVSSDKWCRPNVFIVARKAGLRDEEKNRLFSFTEIIQTDRPSFVSIMVPCSVVKRFYMTVPIAFALAHLPRTSSSIVLQLPDKDRLWQVQCYVQPHSVGFTTGWKKFVHNNRLKVGDICFFELVEIQKDILMNVYISRI